MTVSKNVHGSTNHDVSDRGNGVSYVGSEIEESKKEIVSNKITPKPAPLKIEPSMNATISETPRKLNATSS